MCVLYDLTSSFSVVFTKQSGGEVFQFKGLEHADKKRELFDGILAARKDT